MGDENDDSAPNARCRRPLSMGRTAAGTLTACPSSSDARRARHWARCATTSRAPIPFYCTFQILLRRPIVPYQGDSTFTILRNFCGRRTFTVLRENGLTFTQPPPYDIQRGASREGVLWHLPTREMLMLCTASACWTREAVSCEQGGVRAAVWKSEMR